MVLKSVLILGIFVLTLQTIELNASGVVVNTTSGSVRGFTTQALGQTINVYLGIPFAEPPIGELRFRKPVALKRPKQGIIDGTKPGNSCIQNFDPILIFPNFPNVTQSEDCLVLNIFSQNRDDSIKLKPVMFWIYGGSSQVGSISQYSGAFLATHDVVIVATNYRLGPIGWLYGGRDSAPGNQGLYDQRLALLWVRENIHLFGGERSQITLFGESAGSASVSVHILSPLTRGLFRRAILESGAQIRNKIRDIQNTTEALTQVRQAAKDVNCANDNTWLDCLRHSDVNIINNLPTGAPMLYNTEYFPQKAQDAFATNDYNRDIDILAGITQNEGAPLLAFLFNPLPQDFSVNDFKNIYNTLNQTFFYNLNIERIAEFYLKGINTSSSAAVIKALTDSFGDILNKCPTYFFSKQFAKLNPNRKVYFFEQTYAHGDLLTGCVPQVDGVCHGSDLTFVFGTPISEPNSLQLDIDFSLEVMKLWTNFAKFGQPTNSYKWPQLLSKKNSPKVKELNAFNFGRIFDNPYKLICDKFWKNYFL